MMDFTDFLFEDDIPDPTVPLRPICPECNLETPVSGVCCS